MLSSDVRIDSNGETVEVVDSASDMIELEELVGEPISVDTGSSSFVDPVDAAD